MENNGKISKKKNRVIKTVLLAIFLLVFLLVGFELYISKYWLTVTTYTIASDRINHSVRIVQLTDQHDTAFGKNNKRLIDAVRNVSPDLILITGDIVNSKTGANLDNAVSVISQLSEIAPVYFSYGNQEKSLEADYGIDVTSAFTEAGATVLEFSYNDIEVNGQKLRLGGIYGYCLPDVFAQETKRDNETVFLKEFQDTDDYTILMCHIPVSWLRSGGLYDWNIDLVFSGHVHGGQVRIPFVGGLWAPDLGWFPGELCGLYTTDEDKWPEVFKALKDYSMNGSLDSSYYEGERTYEPSTLVLSRGLGNTDSVPRFNNIPEIVVVDLVPKE